jgi:hypothetical protein
MADGIGLMLKSLLLNHSSLYQWATRDHGSFRGILGTVTGFGNWVAVPSFSRGHHIFYFHIFSSKRLLINLVFAFVREI